MRSAIVAYALPPPPATLLLVVDMFGLQDPDTVARARRLLAERGYATALVLTQTDGVVLAQPVIPLPPLLPAPVPCPATAPHDTCRLCRGTGVVEAVDTVS